MSPTKSLESVSVHDLRGMIKVGGTIGYWPTRCHMILGTVGVGNRL